MRPAGQGMTALRDRGRAMGLRASVFGPAYLDRVLRVDCPLHDPATGLPLDQSVDGVGRFREGSMLELREPSRHVIEVGLPDGWPGPAGVIELSHDLSAGPPGRRRV